MDFLKTQMTPPPASGDILQWSIPMQYWFATNSNIVEFKEREDNYKENSTPNLFVRPHTFQ